MVKENVLARGINSIVREIWEIQEENEKTVCALLQAVGAEIPAMCGGAGSDESIADVVGYQMQCAQNTRALLRVLQEALMFGQGPIESVVAIPVGESSNFAMRPDAVRASRR